LTRTLVFWQDAAMDVRTQEELAMLAGRGDEDACVAILASYDKWL
jgi:hypothetical protein